MQRRLISFGTALLVALLGGFCFVDAAPQESGYGGPVRIAKLLWKANGKSAASTLMGSISKAIEREQVTDLKAALGSVADQTSEIISENDQHDPRLAASAASQLILGKTERAFPIAVDLLAGDDLDEASRDALVGALFVADRSRAMSVAMDHLKGSGSSEAAVSWVQACLRADRTQAANEILSNWGELPATTRQVSIEPLSASQDTMLLLLSAIDAGSVSKDLLNTNQLRKWLQASDESVTSKIEKIWGSIRETDDAARQELVKQTLKLLNSGVSGSATRGEAVFQRVCSQCHVLHGKGFEVGPNIVGNGRGSLQQLVSNVLDPSLVIGEAFQAKTVLTVDGEVVAGLVAGENDRYLRIKVQGGKVVEFDKEEDIEQVKKSSKSLMPEGVEEQMKEQELVDLFAYLCLLKPLGADDNELIPGTPDGLVQP